MVGYLLDTDVISKRAGPTGRNIRRWLSAIDDNELTVSAISVFEIARGVQKKRDAGETEVADQLQAGLEILKSGFAGRILIFDAAVAERWGAIAGSERRQWMDRAQIAIAQVHGLVLVTCNSNDMKGRGVEVVNPDRSHAGHWAPDGVRI